MTRNRATIALATAATSALVLIPAGAANAQVLKGLQDQEMTVNNPSLSQSFFTDAKSANVGLVRFNTSWDGKSKSPDGGQVAAIRAAIVSGVQAGIKNVEVSPNITGGASFNPKGSRKGPTAASKVSASAYKTYVQTLSAALKDTGATIYYAPINEPNWYRHLPKRGGAALYLKLHNIAYTEIKKVDPKAKILFGELLPTARALSRNNPNGQSTDAGAFVRQVLGLSSRWKATGSASSHTVKADGVSLHTYDFKANPNKKRSNRDQWTQANLAYAKSDLKKAAKTGRLPSAAAGRIYLTEFAYKTTGPDKISTTLARTYLKRAWAIAKKQKARSFVWYQLRDPKSRGESWQSGLKSRTGGTRATWSTFRTLR